MTSLVKDPTAQTVKVTIHAKSTTDNAFVEGATVGHYLEANGYSLDEGYTVSVNGEPSSLTDQVEPDSVIVVAPHIANG